MLYKSVETCHPVWLPCKGTNILIFVTCGASLPASMICTTTDTISIPVGEMYLHARMFCVLAHTSSIPMGAINFYMQWCKDVFYTGWYHFYSHVWDVFTYKNVLYTRSVCLLFPCLQCQSLKPVLSQCSQTSFVTVDDFIALYTHLYIFYSNGCNKFLHARTIFTLADTIAPIFTLLIEIWPHANQAMVTNN